MTTKDNMKTFIVANPRAGNGWLGKVWPSLQDRIRLAFGPFDHAFTSCPRDAGPLTRRALAEGYEMVVAMGGDGTVSEVVNGFFMDREPVNEEAVLGILPFGTGGDLVRSLNLSTRLSVAAAALRGKDTRAVDVGVLHCDDECRRRQPLYFINVASFGIGGLVDTLVNETPKILGGTLSFMLGTLRAAAVYQNCPLKLELDGEREIHLTALNVAVANGQFFGGGMHIAPWARLDDGLFDVVALGDFSPWELVTRGHRIYRGTHLGHPKVRFDRARHISATPVERDRAVLLDVDGETPGRLPATFEVIPKALRIKVSGGLV